MCKYYASDSSLKRCLIADSSGVVVQSAGFPIMNIALLSFVLVLFHFAISVIPTTPFVSQGGKKNEDLEKAISKLKDVLKSDDENAKTLDQLLKYKETMEEMFSEVKAICTIFNMLDMKKRNEIGEGGNHLKMTMINTGNDDGEVKSTPREMETIISDDNAHDKNLETAKNSANDAGDVDKNSHTPVSSNDATSNLMPLVDDGGWLHDPRTEEQKATDIHDLNLVDPEPRSISPVSASAAKPSALRRRTTKPGQTDSPPSSRTRSVAPIKSAPSTPTRKVSSSVTSPSRLSSSASPSPTIARRTSPPVRSSPTSLSPTKDTKKPKPVGWNGELMPSARARLAAAQQPVVNKKPVVTSGPKRSTVNTQSKGTGSNDKKGASWTIS